MELSKRRRIWGILIAPNLGVIAGVSCCISLSILLATVIPADNVFFLLRIGNTAHFLAYILLPPSIAIHTLITNNGGKCLKKRHCYQTLNSEVVVELL